MSDFGPRRRLPWHGHLPIAGDGHQTEVWAVGFAHLDLDAVQDIRCLPIDDDEPPPSLPLRYYAADPEGTSLLRLRELASVLYLPPGVTRWKLSPRLGLAERAALALAEFPVARVVAAQLDERRCWAQLRGTDPVLFTLQDSATDAPPADGALPAKRSATDVPRVVAALLIRYRVSGGLGKPDLGHRLSMETSIPVRVNGRLHQVLVSAPDPGIAAPPDTLAPRPCDGAQRTRLVRPSWQRAETAASALVPTLIGEGERVGRKRVDRTVITLCSVLTYAVATETGQPPAAVGLRQLRYRLGETSWQEDGPLARKRCQDWLYWALWSAGHQIGSPPTTPPNDLLYDFDYRRQVLLDRLAVLDAGPDRRRDDPVVRTWADLTRASAGYPEEHVYSDGTSDWSAPSWRVPFDEAWQAAVALVDAVLVRRRGGWPTESPILVDERADDPDSAGRADRLTPAVVLAPYWVFDHDQRTVTALSGYFVRDRRPWPVLTSNVRSAPVLANRVRLDPSRSTGSSPG